MYVLAQRNHLTSRPVAESTGAALNATRPTDPRPDNPPLSGQTVDPRDLLPPHKRPSHPLVKASTHDAVNSDPPSGITDSWKDRMQSDFLQQKKRKKRPRKTDILRLGNDKEYSNEYRIKRKLLLHYDKTTRPVRNDSTTTILFVGVSLYHILDTVSTACLCMVRKTKVKVSSYTAQYPILGIAQSALHFTSLTVLFNQTPSQLLWEASSHMPQLMRIDCSYTYPLFVYSQVLIYAVE